MKLIFCNLFLFVGFTIALTTYSQVPVDGIRTKSLPVIAQQKVINNSRLDASYVNEIKFTPYVVFKDEPFSMICKTKSSDISSIIVYLGDRYKNLFLVNDILADSLVLLDNGQDGDMTAGDRIFTLENIRRNPDDLFSEESNSSFIGVCTVKFVFNYGYTFTEEVNISAGMRYINEGEVSIPEVRKINDTLQYSSHVVNVVVKVDMKSQWDYIEKASAIEIVASKIYYRYFPDDRDFFCKSTTYPTPGTSAAGYGTVSNNVIGTHAAIYCENDICMADWSQIYGSKGRLKGVVDMHYLYGGEPSLLNHELMHHWAVMLSPELHLDAHDEHWGAVEFPCTALGGFSVNHMYHYKDSIYRSYSDTNYATYYNTLELYLMGLLPIDSVSFPFKTLVNFKYKGSYWLWDSTYVPPRREDGFELIADSILYVDKAMYLNYMPARSPDYTVSQKDFTMAQLVVSDRMLSPKEMAFYHYQMEDYEKRILQRCSYKNYVALNFYSATRGRGTITTRLPDIPLAVNDFPMDEELRIYPNPIHDWLMIENLSDNPYTLLLRDINGRLLLIREIEADDQGINLSSYPAGLYLLEFINLKTNKRKLSKLVIE
jgi:hypothetical protein